METETSADRATLAREFVGRTHMQDWTQNDRRQELAQALGLTSQWQSHAAYLEARAIAGLDAAAQTHQDPGTCLDPQWHPAHSWVYGGRTIPCTGQPAQRREPADVCGCSDPLCPCGPKPGHGSYAAPTVVRRGYRTDGAR